jgi:hypothetical protein
LEQHSRNQFITQSHKATKKKIIKVFGKEFEVGEFRLGGTPIKVDLLIQPLDIEFDRAERLPPSKSMALAV